MPASDFHPGDVCSLHARVCNDTGEFIPQAPVFVFLDIGTGDYWFAPTWAHYPADIDGYLLDLPTGLTPIEVIPEFSWPAGAGNFDGPAVFWGAVTDAAVTTVIGNIGQWEFGYHEN